MSEFRELQAKLQKIEENYFKDLDIDLQEFRRANSKLPPDQLVRLARDKFGQEAATYLSNKIEGESDYADYMASSSQPHMVDEDDNSDLDGDDFLNDGEYQMVKDAMAERGHEPHSLGFNKKGQLQAMDDLSPGSPNYIFADDGTWTIEYAPGHEPEVNDKADFDDWMSQNPFESIDEEGDEVKGVNDKYDDETLNCKHCGDYFCTSKFGGECPEIQTDMFAEEREITYLKQPEGYEPPKMPERHKLDSMDWMHVPDDVIQMMKSFEHKMKSQNVWDKGVELAGSEDQLWKHMQWRAEEVMDDYRGSGEGISSSDMNHFVRGIFSDMGEDDIWGWDKPKLTSDEDMERDKANRGAKYSKAIRGEGLDEARGRVVEVPPELRGSDSGNELGGSSRDAERFLADLGPDDDVSHDVVDPETGELLDWPTKGLNRDDDDDWRAAGGTKRERGKTEWEKKQARKDELGDDVPNLVLYSGTSFGSDTDHAHEFMSDLRNSDFYNVVWKETSELVDDPDDFYDKDYDVGVAIPVALKRKDGKKLTQDDHDNIKEIMKATKAASTMGNLGLGYAGTTEDGTTARFYPSFM